MFIKRYQLGFTVVLPIVVLSQSISFAEDNVARAENIPDHLVVLRFSDKFINSVMDDRDYDRQTRVRDEILGTSIHGVARIVGQPGVKFIESPDNATFYITFNGTVVSRTVGYNRGAVIHSHSTTKFTAYRKVAFKPGEGFYALPAKVSAQTKTNIDNISSTRGGLIGRVITRRARRLEAESHDQAEEIARQKTTRRIEVAFDRSTEYRLARLNKLAEYRYMATAAIKSAGKSAGRRLPSYACCTTPHYVQIAARLGDSGSQIMLPAEAKSGGAPVELWVHESLLENPYSGGVGFIAQRLQSVRALPILVQSLMGDRLSAQKVANWQIVQLEPQSLAKSDQPTRSPRHVVARVSLDRPTPSTRRIWTSGPYTADAEFIRMDGNIVRLRRSNGVNTSIPIEKLSVADRVWIQDYLQRR